MSRYNDQSAIGEERRRIRRLLWRWGRVTAYCARRQRDIEDFQQLIARATDIHPQALTGMPHGSAISDPTERAASMVAQLKERYETRIEGLTADINEELRFSDAMDVAMQSLDGKEAAIVELKYKREYSTERISTATHYSASRIEQIERGAVDKPRAYITTEEDEK